MVRKIDLSTAKESLKNDAVFIGKNETFLVADFERYGPNLTYIIPNEWTLDSKAEIESPIRFTEVKKLTDNMNIDFDAAKTEVVFGESWNSKNGKRMFKITPPDQARDVLICSNWGGCFEDSRGQNLSYANEIGADYFIRCSSNGGGAGCDYYIVPVNFIAKREEKADVTDILNEVTQKEKQRVAENEKAILLEREKIDNSRSNREEFEPLIKDVVDAINDFNKKYGYSHSNVKFGEDYIVGNYGGKIMYGQDALNKYSGELNKLQEAELNKNTFQPRFEELMPLADKLNCKLKFGLYNISLIDGNKCEYKYSYNESGVNSCVEKMDNLYKSNEEKKRETENRVKALEAMLKKETAEKEAKALGYPSDFTYYNRVSGSTGQSHAYVIQPNGAIRENDSLDYANPNHQYKFSIHTADGTQHWNQIMPGEIVIAYTKECTDEPVVETIEWMPEHITPAQLETIQEITVLLQERYYGQPDRTSGEPSPDIKGWDELLKATNPSLTQLKIAEAEQIIEFNKDRLKNMNSSVRDMAVEEIRKAQAFLNEVNNKEPTISFER